MNQSMKAESLPIALQQIVEEQAQKIQLYEKKITEVVSAFKSLRKEKEALEETVKALSSTANISATDEDAKNLSPSHLESSDSRHQIPPPLSNSSDLGPAEATNSTSTPDTANQNMFTAKLSCQQCATLKKRLKTLTRSMATLNDEKRRMEEAYVAEKKLLKETSTKERSRRESELEQALLKSHEETRREVAKCEQMSAILQEKETEIRKSLQAVEEERNIHALLQERWTLETKRFLQEKAKREDELESRVGELSLLLGECERGRSADQQVIQQLRDKLSSLTISVDATPAAVSPQPPSRISASREVDLLRDTQAPFFMDQVALSGSAEQEVCHWWRLARHVIHKLQLANGRLITSLPLNLAFHEKLLTSLGGMEVLLEDSVEPDIEIVKSFLETVKLSDQEKKLTTLSRSSSLLEETRAAPESPSSVAAREVRDLQHQVARLQKEALHRETLHSEAVERLRHKVADLEWRHSEALQRTQQEHNAIVAELQRELASHRNRTILLLEEKEEELAAWRRTAVTTTVAVEGEKKKRDNDVLKVDDEEGKNDDANDWERRLFANSGARGKRGHHRQDTTAKTGSRGGECSLFHCVEVKARKDMEITRLRSEKHELEENLRKLKHEAVEMEMAHQTRITEMKRLLEEWQTSGSLNGIGGLSSSQLQPVSPGADENPINTTGEYLRNVVFHYLTQHAALDPVARMNLLRVIASILHFSPQQKKALEKSVTP